MQLEVLGELRLTVPSQPGRALHLSAASGLVKLGARLYVVADDELHLGVFPASGAAPGMLLRLFEGELPEAAEARKQRKPDLEALLLLPAFARCPHGALLALGSGSKAQRCRAVLLPLTAPASHEHGVDLASLRVLDLSDWFATLGAAVGKLNIEGAAVCGERLVLMHRGNKADQQNCLLSFALHEVLAAIERHDAVAARILGIDHYQLGRVAGVPLCFTDAAALPDGRLVFAAVAEDTADSYLDGPCRGAALGVIGADRQLAALYPLEQSHKVEGVHAEPSGSQTRLWLVTDADDPNIAAKLLSGVLPA